MIIQTVIESNEDENIKTDKKMKKLFTKTTGTKYC